MTERLERKKNMIYKDEINRLCRNLLDRKASLMEELQTLPDGEFYVCTGGGSRRYYQRFRRTGNRKKERRIGIKKDPQVLNALVRKKYVIEAISILEKDISAVEELLRLYVPVDENSVMEAFVSRYPELSDGIYRVTSDNVKSGGITAACVVSFSGRTRTLSSRAFRHILCRPSRPAILLR